jgi:hypothetical protein
VARRLRLLGVTETILLKIAKDLAEKAATEAVRKGWPKMLQWLHRKCRAEAQVQQLHLLRVAASLLDIMECLHITVDGTQVTGRDARGPIVLQDPALASAIHKAFEAMRQACPAFLEEWKKEVDRLKGGGCAL